MARYVECPKSVACPSSLCSHRAPHIHTYACDVSCPQCPQRDGAGPCVSLSHRAQLIRMTRDARVSWEEARRTLSRCEKEVSRLGKAYARLRAKRDALRKGKRRA
jgi:hypothetical protein